MLSLERQNALREEYRQRHPGWRPATEVYASLVREHLRPESRVLDLGCGRGGLVEQLDHPLHLLTGLDPDFQSLREHRLAGSQPPLARVAGLSHRPPFEDGSFDLVCASWVLEHLSNPSSDLGQIARILRPGGIFIFITPNKGHPLVRFNRLIGRFSAAQDRVVESLYGRAPADTFPAYYRANDRDTLHRLALGSGLSLAELRAIPDPSYLAFNTPLFHLACWLEDRLQTDQHIHLVGRMQR
jgi:SAM-dependent methyltransferase